MLLDTVNAGAGIAISTRFSPVPLGGHTSVQRNSLIRTGGYEHNWNAELGALWLFADTADIAAAVLVKDLEISDSSYQGIQPSYQRAINDVNFDHVSVSHSESYGIDLNATGSARFDHVSVTSSGKAALNNIAGYTLVRGAGNSGF